MTDKSRLDVTLVNRGLVGSREKAKALIMAGQVYVNGAKELKAGAPVKPGCEIEVRENRIQYVSRGGLKLEKAVKSFALELDGLVCMDIGASTGGFTDCMLRSGAVKVYSIDVGYGQLAWKLRTDSRVVNMERTNFRYVTRDDIPEEIDFASVDVSFISLDKILPVMHGLLSPRGRAVCLIKPQFEAGREKVGKKGVVRDPEVHVEVIDRVRRTAVEDGFTVLGLDYSPVKGPEGNIEYLIYIEKSGEPSDVSGVISAELVRASHAELDRSNKEE